MTKERLSVSVDADVLARARDLVGKGFADSLSAWVNEALRMRAHRDSKLQAMEEFIAHYEAEHGQITEQDMERAERWVQETAIHVRGGKVVRDPRRQRPGAA